MLKLLYGAIFALLLTTTADAGEICSSTEQSLADYAHQVAESDGHVRPKLLIGVLHVESRTADQDTKYRVVKQGSGKQASTFYGAAQLTIAAAKEVMKRFPELWRGFNTQTDDELKARLILDDRFNVRVASKYLLIMGVNRNPEKGVAAYNVGIGAVELINYQTLPYMLKVKQASK